MREQIPVMSAQSKRSSSSSSSCQSGSPLKAGPSCNMTVEIQSVVFHNSGNPVWNISALGPTAGQQSSTANYPSNKGSQWTQMCSTFLLEGAEQHPSHCSPTVSLLLFPPVFKVCAHNGSPLHNLPVFLLQRSEDSIFSRCSNDLSQDCGAMTHSKRNEIAPGLDAKLGSKINREHLQNNICQQNIGQRFWALHVLAT